MQLSPSQIAQVAQETFGDLGPQVVADMTAIALAESGGNAAAHNLNPDTRDDSHGLWQINVRPDANPQYASWDLTDPYENAKAARAIYDAGGYAPWSTWGNGMALDHWDEAAGVTTELYSGLGTAEPVAAPQQTGTGSYRDRLRATLAAAGARDAGSTSMAGPTTAGAPVTSLQGVDLVKLAAEIANMLASQRQSGLSSAGYADYGALGMGGGFGPTLAREQFQAQTALAQQSMAAARDDAARNYSLDLQRFGLAYADTAFQQRLAAASQQIQMLDLQTRRSGPEDWLRYNHIINNKPAPTEPTVNAGQGPGAVAPTVGGQAPAMLQLGQKPPTQPDGTPWYIDGNRQATNPFGSSPSGAWYSASQGEYDKMAAIADQDQQNGGAGPDVHPEVNGIQGQDWTPGTTADSPLTPGADQDVQRAQGYEWDPNGSGGVHLLAFGGTSTRPAGASGMHAAVVGDAQRGNRANPELVMSRTPIAALPLQGKNSAGPKVKKAAMAKLPKRATGGMSAAAAPFVQKVTGGDEAVPFGARGEALGSYGTSPLDYNKFLKLLPSEQAMTKGYVETPRDQGGLGGWFPDELERGRRASFQGLSLSPATYSAA